MQRLSTQNRLFALFGLLFAGSVAILWVLSNYHRAEYQRLLESSRVERIRLMDSFLALRSEGLRNFANDYTFWDELVSFVQQPDAAWGQANLEVSLGTFRASGVWVFDADGKQVYAALREIDPSLRRLPFEPAELLEVLRRDRFASFFADSPAGVLEFHAAPIQPTADVERASAPQGWFLVARLWDAAFIGSLQHALGGELSLAPAGATAATLSTAADGIIHLEQPLRDFRGRPVAVLHSDYSAEPLRLVIRANLQEKLLFIAFGTATMLAIIIGISRWVLRPLRLLAEGLTGRTPPALAELKSQPDVLGRLAQLVDDSLAQRRSLEREVDERRRIEAALRQSEESLVSAAELRSRLARDLHDGVIQSIYAAGLGLEGMRGLIRSDPVTAESRLDAAQSSLNQTIREVRSFIHGLEPETNERPDFARSLQSLVTTLRSLHLVEIDTRIELAPLRLSPREEVHALQILRECVSNAIRHGQAARVRIDFIESAAGPLMTVQDDGRGFDPALAAVAGGSGLANLASRASEIGARLDISSQPGNGTRITLRFSQR